MLLTTATIWGMAFVAQRVGMDYVGPLTFSWTRFCLAILVLIPVVRIMDRSARKKALEGGSEQKALTPEERKLQKKQLMKASVAAAGVLSMANILQQIGLVSTSAERQAL
jgi:drug/metabolite transporter (DMT)-like permease